MDLFGSWDRYIPLIEFSYNSSYQSSIGMTPYEALYGQKCRTPVCWTELNEHKVIGPDIVKDTEEKVQVIRQRLKVACDRQKSYAKGRSHSCGRTYKPNISWCSLGLRGPAFASLVKNDGPAAISDEASPTTPSALGGHPVGTLSSTDAQASPEASWGAPSKANRASEALSEESTVITVGLF